jgi:hypothetical protein
MVRQLFSDGSLTPDVAAHIMTCVLQALQLHGQHDANLGSLVVLGAQLYEVLRPMFPIVIEVCVTSMLRIQFSTIYLGLPISSAVGQHAVHCSENRFY